MRMKVLVYRPSKAAPIAAVVMMIVFLVIFAAFTLPLLKAFGMVTFLLVFGVFFVLIPIIVAVMAFSRYSKASKTLSMLMNEASISESGVLLPQPVQYDVGIYTARGEWRGSGKHRHYYVSHSFSPTDHGEGSSIPIPRGEFSVDVKADDTGEIVFPAIRIPSGPYGGALLLYLDPNGEVEGSGTIQVSHGEDSAQLTYRGDGRAISGTVYSMVKKARKAKVELYRPGLEGNRFRVGEGITFDFSRAMLPEESMLIVAYEGFSPADFRKMMKGGEYLMGHGEYGIRLVLDIPLRPDVVEEGRFRVRYEEAKEEEEEKESWGL
jgi:hypothetical protein